MTPMTLVRYDAAVIKELIDEASGGIDGSDRASYIHKNSGRQYIFLLIAAAGAALCCGCILVVVHLWAALFAFGLSAGLMTAGLTAFLVNRARIQQATKIINASMSRQSEHRDQLSLTDDGFNALQKSLDALCREHREFSVKERAIADYSSSWVCSLDNEDRILATTHAISRLTGYSADEVNGRLFIGMAAESAVKDALAALNKARSEGKCETVLPMRTNDNHPLYIEWSIEQSQNAATLFCAGQDVTARRLLEQLKQEFLQMITHDLKAPLSNIILTAEVLLSDDLDENGKLQRLKAIVSRAEHLLLFVNELLDIDKFEAGQLELDKAQCEIEPIVEASQEMVSQVVQAKRIHLSMHLPDQRCTFIADGRRLTQVLVNLLSNAVKFSRSGGEVKLEVQPTEDGMFFAVSDNGRGISAQDQPKVFDRFRQLEIADSSLKGGTGLGLSICKAIVEAHGGKINVESVVGQGARFSFVIPQPVLEEAAEASGTLQTG